MYNKILLLALAFLLSFNQASAADFITKYVPDARIVGEGRLRVFMLDVYDATLLAPKGKLQSGKPLALQLVYLREISGKKIADRSRDEIKDLGLTDDAKLALWHAEMLRIFPDVQENTNLTGILTSSGSAVFYMDGKNIGEIKDPGFGKAFFDIWLSPKTSAPKLRQKLLGQAKG